MIQEGYYNGIIEIGEDGQPIQPIIVLSSRGGHKKGVIQNAQEVERTHPLNTAAELSFDVYKEDENGECELWEDIRDFKFIHIPYDNSWYEAQVTVDEENDIIKHVTCIHANEAELGQLMLYETEINTEADIARDDYKETVFYNDADPTASLLNRILADKAPHYSIYHVDDSLKPLFRMFSFNGTSIYDALMQIAEEVGCLFIFGEWNTNDGAYHRTISAYDLQDYCTVCHRRGTFTDGICDKCGSSNTISGYGEDTGIYISRENLAESINYSGDPDSVKNCFRMVAGDDLMTATIKNCNPAMSNYLWYFSDEMKADMSTALVDRLNEYDEDYIEYRDTKNMFDVLPNVPRFSNSIDKYNEFVDQYSAPPYGNSNLVEIANPILGTINLTEDYYHVLDLYGYLKTTMMPADEIDTGGTTAAKQLLKMTGGTSGTRMSKVGVASVSSISTTTANSAIQSYAKVYVDNSRYSIDVTGLRIDTSGGNKYWVGTITLTSYTNEDDTATGIFDGTSGNYNKIRLFDGTNEYSTWLEQKVKKAMANKKANDINPISLFDLPDVPNPSPEDYAQDLENFINAIKLYSADNLEVIYSMAEAAISVLTEQGVNKKESTETSAYRQIYLPYYRKMKAVITEQSQREKELRWLQRPTDSDGNPIPNTANGLLNYIRSCQSRIQKALDLETYLGASLWEELSFYRREQEYSNPNYISDGLTDAEILDMAQEYYDGATKEIIKSATLQHSISANLYDLLLMPQFRDFQAKFKVGNWIHLRVDGKLFKLRLVNWTENYGSIEKIDVEFSDVLRVGTAMTDVSSILSNSKSMATTYNYTAKQANKGANASTTVQTYHNQGISFGDVKAIVSKGRTDIKYDDEGILLRRVKEDDPSSYQDEQARIYNNGIYITSDGWETISTGLGHYTYIDPDTGQRVSAYGIIADTVLGRLILGENLKIYGENGKYEMGGNGLIITAKEDGQNANLFTVQKLVDEDEPTEHYEKYIYVNADGEVVIAGNSVRIQNQPLVEYIDDKIEEDIGEITQPVTVVIESSAGNVFKNNKIATRLTAIVYRGNTNVTSTVSEFTWTKKDKNGNIDDSWTRHTYYPINYIDITSSDVTEKAVFGCDVTVPEPNNG